MGSARDDLHRLADELPADLAGEVVCIAEALKARRAARDSEEDAELDAETRAWQDADLAPPIDPYDWGPQGPPVVKPVRYEPGVGFVVVGGRDA